MTIDSPLPIPLGESSAGLALKAGAAVGPAYPIASPSLETLFWRAAPRARRLILGGGTHKAVGKLQTRGVELNKCLIRDSDW